MPETPIDSWRITEQNRLFSEAMERNWPRLRNFLHRYARDTGEAEDILQDVFYELLEAYRMMKPIEHVSSWLFRVARNRVVDLFRKRKAASLSEPAMAEDDSSSLTLEDLLPSPDEGPDAIYARMIMLEAIEDAIEELPKEQREIFIAHEVMGVSFKDYAAETGVGVNTLLSRKRYAVLSLRQRLQSLYDEVAGEK
ncbi:RNA polymerase sigma factor [Edaphobacter albus]|uniref:RNA polymerase sigma factor n=1 Tax=Edaphobacter sp. 4G125 TaxID=2763071 RepID=UPI0016494BF5|nr:sigma-70 family RNA polymerase sigma factor [Edaphobacter sp. 4G125]QNI38239.1 sigma-70 family RNA polymerase sigma factor [Edaphobacter sp. 4G125]